MIFANPLPWFLSQDTITLLLIILIWFLINLLITTIFLKIALAIVGAKHTDFGEVFVTALVVTLLCSLLFIYWWLTIITLILVFYFIGKRHEIGFCMAIIVTILAIIIAFLVIFLLIIVLGALGLTIQYLFF
ncbi:MAG: hypothetical protein ACFFBP_00795 [Promethearchaeota archaeon]